MEHLVLAVIEAKRIPRRVFAPLVVVEIEVVRAIEAAKAFQLVLHGVAVHDVHDHGDAHLVRLVDQLFQLVGRTETGRGGEEAAHMIAEGAIVGMLLDGHDLDGVVAILGDAGQHLLAKLAVGAHLLLARAHSDVALVDHQRVRAGLELLDSEFIGFLGVPNLGAEDLGLLVLHHTAYPGRDALARAAVPLHQELEQVAMMQTVGGENAFPHAIGLLLQLILGVFLPVVERTY